MLIRTTSSVQKAQPLVQTSSGRSGVYVLHRDGYREFHPKPLPPDPPLEMSGRLSRLLSDADRELGRLDGNAEILPDPDIFIYSYIRKEAVLSSQIEGTHSTLVDLLHFEAGVQEKNRPRDVREVANYVAATDYALGQIRAGQPLTLALLQQVHQRLLRGRVSAEHHPGELRTEQNWIGPVPEPRLAEFVPPPPALVPRALADLENYWRNSADPPLIRAGLAHAQFETIHPFLDGNGRLGRLLVTLILITSGTMRRPLLYLSHYLLKNRNEYVRRLQNVRDTGDWEGWIEFFLEGIRSVSGQSAETARAILRLREQHRGILQRELGQRGTSAAVLLDGMFRSPFISVKDAERCTGLSQPAANKLVAEMVKKGLLVEMTGKQRNRVFEYQSYIELLSREPKS